MTKTYFFWDPLEDNIVQERDESGALVAEYTTEPDLYGNVISQERNDHTYYYHYDGEGNTSAVTDQNGNIVETATYSAFGEVVAKSMSVVNPFGYKGALGYYANGDTDQIEARARSYSPQSGRWLSEDPAGFIDGPNAYVFVLNDPINKSDPSGLALEIIQSVPRKLNPTCKKISATAAWWFRVRPWPCRGNLGFFIQRVTVNCMICDCVDTNECYHTSFQYWEAWPVHKPNTPQRERLPNVPATLRVKDTAAYSTDKPRGSYRQSGVVRFYCVAPRGRQRQDGELDPDEVSIQPTGQIPAGPCTTTSGNLARITTEPGFWRRAPAEGGKGRYFRMEWNCCCDVNRATASARP